MNKQSKSAVELHEDVPPDWYYQSIKKNIGQRFWHKTRFREVKKIITKVEGKVLDLGSADGVFTKIILDTTEANKVVGIDILKGSVSWAKNHWKQNKKLEFKIGDAHKLSFKKNTFDAVFALEVLEHVPEPLIVLKEIKRVLKKDGYAILLVPTDNHLFRFIWFFWTKHRGNIWKDCHVQSFSENSLVSLSKEIGLRTDVNKKFLFNMLQIIKVKKK